MTALTITAVSILLGALPASIGYFFKVRREQQRSAKRVLYYLLEIRNSAYKELLTGDKLCELVVQCMEDSVKRHDPSFSLQGEEMPPEIKELYAGLIEKAVFLHSSSLPSKGEYFLALEELASDYPVIAYKIRDNEYMTKTLGMFAEYEGQAKKLYFGDPNLSNEMKESVHQQSQKLNTNLKKELLADIDRDVELLAKKCGMSCQKEVENILSHKSSLKVDGTLKREMDAYVDNLVKDISLPENGSSGLVVTQA